MAGIGRTARVLTALACLLALCDRAAANDPDFIITTWQTEEGLPENSATSMVQTADGYLWFGTFAGLVRFDGALFTVFDRTNTPGLPSNEIVNLHLDRRGWLWISTPLGMAAVKDGEWRIFTPGK